MRGHPGRLRLRVSVILLEESLKYVLTIHSADSVEMSHDHKGAYEGRGKR